MSDPLGLFDVTKSAWWKYVPPGLRGALLGSDDYTQAQPSPGLPAYSTRKPTGGAVALAGETTPGADLRDYGHFSQSAYENFGRGAVSQGFVDSAYSAAALASMVLPFSIAGIFGGRGARTADVVALRTAEEMERKGIDADAIWRETGWGRGADGKWRFEIDDSNARMIDPFSSPQVTDKYIAADFGTKGNDIPTALDLEGVVSHPGLEAAYYPTRESSPDFYLAPIEARGDFSAGTPGSPDTIRLNNTLPLEWDTQGRSTLLHELQHAVQNTEGFAAGGNERIGGDLVGEARLRLSEIERKMEVAQDAARDAARNYISQADRDPEAAKLIEEARAKWFSEFGENPFGVDLVDAVAFEITEREGMVARWGQEADQIRRLARINDAREGYRRLAGEVEARNVQTRADWSAERRRQTPPWETEDVPRISQIIRYR